jgi:hypothetical protein
LDSGFEVSQKDGKYWIDVNQKDYQILKNVLHFSEEDVFILSRTIDKLDVNNSCAARLKQKLTAFLNQDKVIESYIRKEKSSIVLLLLKARREKKQILLINYASGNSQTVKNRMVEPFEFKDDFNLVWAFDTAKKQNLQFKICRIGDVLESPLSWEYEQQHRSKPVDIFRNTGDLNKQVECLLTLKAKNLLIEEYPLAERYLTNQANNQFILKAPIAKYEGPGRFTLGLWDEVKPLGDEGFLEYLKIKIKKYQQILSDSTNSGVDVMTFVQN